MTLLHSILFQSIYYEEIVKFIDNGALKLTNVLLMVFNIYFINHF